MNNTVKDILLDLSKALLYSTTKYPNYKRLYKKLCTNICTYSKYYDNGQVSKHLFHWLSKQASPSDRYHLHSQHNPVSLQTVRNILKMNLYKAAIKKKKPLLSVLGIDSEELEEDDLVRWN